jgi:hypothetical protein
MLLLKTFLIFNSSVLHKLIVHYAPHGSIQAYDTSN